MYEYGFGDLYNMVFYSLVWIILHAVIHEYIWEVRQKKRGNGKGGGGVVEGTGEKVKSPLFVWRGNMEVVHVLTLCLIVSTD